MGEKVTAQERPTWDLLESLWLARPGWFSGPSEKFDYEQAWAEFRAAHEKAAPAQLECSECEIERGVPTTDGVHEYVDHESGERINLCPACYHDALRSGADLT